MSIIPMYKYCARCGCQVPFNSDVGHLGLFCPKCKKLMPPMPFPIPRKKNNSVWKTYRWHGRRLANKEGSP